MTATTVFVRLDPPLARRLAAAAKASRRSRPELVRDLIAEHLPPAAAACDGQLSIEDGAA